MTASQNLAHRFNEDEAVWECYEERRRVRHLLGVDSLLTEDILDRLDWLEAERDCREFRCVARSIPAGRRGNFELRIANFGIKVKAADERGWEMMEQVKGKTETGERER